MEFPLDTEMISYSTESDHDTEYKPSPMLVDPIYISSDEDEEMSSFLSGTISEEDNLADDEGSLASEIRSMSVHVETAMFAPIPIRPTFAQTVVTPPSTPRRQLFTQEDFNFDMGRGWISEERKNHPIGLCRTIIPVVDTPSHRTRLIRARTFIAHTISQVPAKEERSRPFKWRTSTRSRDTWKRCNWGTKELPSLVIVSFVDGLTKI